MRAALARGVAVGTVAGASVAAGVVARRLQRRGTGGAGGHGGYPLAITVARPLDEIAPRPDGGLEGGATGGLTGGFPAPLARIQGSVDIDLRPAPAGRGTEIRLTLVDPDGEVSARDAREALRDAKQIWETGEVLLADSPGSSDATLTGAPLRLATSLGRREGRL